MGGSAGGLGNAFGVGRPEAGRKVGEQDSKIQAGNYVVQMMTDTDTERTNQPLGTLFNQFS